MSSQTPQLIVDQRQLPGAERLGGEGERPEPGLISAIRLARRRRIFGYPGAFLLCVVWIAAGTLSFARHYFQNPAATVDGSLLAQYLTALTCFLPWIPLSAIVFHVEGRIPLGHRRWPRHLAALAAVSVPIVYVASFLTTMTALVVEVVLQLPPDPSKHFWPVPLRELLGHQFLYWPSVGASWLLRTLWEARENERRAARLLLEKSQLETTLRQAELDALRMRLHPHFLFNSLQNISVLTQHDPQTASRMLTKLGDLLRASLRGDGRAETTLGAEVALTESYLAVEQMRFGGRLASRIELDPGTEDALVPSFLLQPLVENAIRHGLDGIRDRGLISIRSRLEGDALVVSVTDNGIGPPAESLSRLGVGIGLGATGERLDRMYPGQHTFSLRAAPGGGTEVRIALPLRREATTEAACERSECSSLTTSR